VKRNLVELFNREAGMSRSPRTAFLITFAFLMTRGSAVCQQADSTGITVAVLREDGVLIPFARYHQGSWLNPWPKPDGYIESNTIADLKRPWFAQDQRPKNTWYSWSAKGGGKTLTASSVVQVDSHCDQIWGLRSDFSNQTSSNYLSNIGLAIDEKLHPEGLREDSEAADRNDLASFLAPVFVKAESGELAKKVPAAKRKVGKLNLSQLYRGPEIKGQYLYYVEATKEYPMPADPQSPDCKVTSLFSGWFSRVPGKNFELLNHDVSTTDCEGMGATHRSPLGIFHLDDRVFVVTSDSRWEVYSFSIFEPALFTDPRKGLFRS
jgi:hypothetical protein